MLEIFQTYRPLIQKTIEAYLQDSRQEHQSVNRWGEEIQDRLLPFINNGKLIRGGLSLLGYQMYSPGDVTPALPLAAAMEFFQSGFLVHDDIMDLDTTRRGNPSIYYQYQQLAARRNITEDARMGQSLGICAGDICFFWAYDLLSRLEGDALLLRRLYSLASREYTKVGLAQMEDVYFGYLEEEVSREEIFNVYRFKTARYTFSLPLMLGAILGGADESQVQILAGLGESLGLIFQIKDDELGLFGDEKQTGKPVGSDISEGKKTLIRYYLLESASEREKLQLSGLFGNPHISTQDIAYVRDLVRKNGILSQIQQDLDLLAAQARDQIKTLRIQEMYQTVLKGLLEYSLGRTV